MPGLRGVRRSTIVLVTAFVVTFALYLVVRPAPTPGVDDGGTPTGVPLPAGTTVPPPTEETLPPVSSDAPPDTGVTTPSTTAPSGLTPPTTAASPSTGESSTTSTTPP
jgi:hypothetical protein